MIRTNRTALAALMAGVCALTNLTMARDARACGGCFHETGGQQTVADITDERMLLAVSQNQTTLYDQIRYSGNPSSFAWVLPIKGTVTVGLSADVMFGSIDALTSTQVNGPALNCPSQPFCGGDNGGGGCALGGSSSDSNAAFSANGGANGATPPPVTVTKQQNVGPYETVQLHSTDPKALNAWLATNNFEVPDDVTTVIDAYVGEGFDFLAMKLLPGQGIQAMRPVRVTMPGASLALPLRMASVGTGATVGITLWIVGSGRYEPQNFPSFRIDDQELVWDWTSSLSNYTTLRSKHEADLNGKGWEVESSIDLNALIISSAILSGGASVSGYASANQTSNADDDYLPVGDPLDGGAGSLVSAVDVRALDIATLLEGASSSGIVRVTRLRGDIAHAAMSTDLSLQASADQSELTNVRQVTNSVNAPVCPKVTPCTADSSSSSSSGCDTASQPASTAGLLITILSALGLFFTRIVRVGRKRR